MRCLINAAESRIAFNKERQAELEARVSQNQSDIVEAQEKLDQQLLDFETAEQTLNELTSRIESQQALLAEHESRAATQRAEREEKDDYAGWCLERGEFYHVPKVASTSQIRLICKQWKVSQRDDVGPFFMIPFCFT